MDIFSNLPDASKSIILFLQLSPFGCEFDIIEKHSHIRHDLFVSIFSQLVNSNVIRAVHGNIYSLESKIPEDEFKKYLLRTDTKDKIFKVISAFYLGKYDIFFKYSLDIFQKSIDEESYVESKRLYEILITYYIKMHIPLSCNDIINMYIKLSYKFISIGHSFPWYQRETMILILKTRGLACATKYSDYIKLLNLSLGYLCVTNFSLKNRLHFNEYLTKEINQESNIYESIEMSQMIIPFKCMLYYINGNFIKSINCVYSIASLNIDISENYYFRMLYSYATMSAIASGEYDIAFNILDEAYRLTDGIRNQKLAHDYFYALKALVYIFKHDYKSALSILDPCIDKESVHGITPSSRWAIRIKTYFYFITGDIKKAYNFYIDMFHDAFANGYTHHGYILAPFMLEILAGFHIAGFARPFQFSIFDEIHFSLNSPCALLHIVAQRLFSEVTAKDRGWDAEEAQRAIQGCMRLAFTIAAPMEQSKTLLAYARMLIATGNNDGAIAAINQMQELNNRYGHSNIPGDINSFIEKYSSHEQYLGTRNIIHNEKNEEDSIPYIDDGKLQFIYACSAMRRLEDKITLVAPKDAPVLVLGESGVGKEYAARKIHERSGRKGRFIAVNVSTIPEELFESEFYGYEKGAFTGAVHSKQGLFELADNGTLFLDEVADVSPRIQVKLLRVLQEKEFLRVGGTKLLKSEFRLVAATNKNLKEEVQSGAFREDLYYRINVVSLTIPPLRERGNDIMLIAQHFLSYFSAKYKSKIRQFSTDDQSFLMSYSWPGNVRELRNYIERFVLLTEPEQRSEMNKLLSDPSESFSHESIPSSNIHTTQKHIFSNKNIFIKLHNEDAEDISLTLDELQKAYMEYIYIIKNGVVGGKNGIAETLGVSRVTVYNLMKKYQLKERFSKKIQFPSSDDEN